MSWEFKKLSTVAEILMGQSPEGKSYNNNCVGLPLLNGAADYKGNKFLPKKYTNNPTKIAIKGDILLGIRATIGNLSISDGDYCIGRGLAAIRVDEMKVNRGFIVHFLSQQIAKLNIEASGSTIKGIVKEDLFGMQIPLPPLATQKRIADILDTADALRRKDQELLTKYDQLAQAIFIDMFGDPVKNEKGWEVKKLGDCLDKIQIGPFGTQLHESDYVEDGIPLINPTHIGELKIKPNRKYTISKIKFEAMPQYHLKENDVILGRRGEMGRCALVTKKEDGYFCGTGSLFLRVKPNFLESVFLTYFLNYDTTKKELEKCAKGITMANLNKNLIRDFKIIFPSISQQIIFKNSVLLNQLNIELIRNNISKSTSLFSSLIHQAFNGTLVS